MFLKLFLFFTIIPLTEFYLLLKLGQAIGLWPTLGVVFGTGLFCCFLENYGILLKGGIDIFGFLVILGTSFSEFEGT